MLCDLYKDLFVDRLRGMDSAAFEHFVSQVLPVRLTLLWCNAYREDCAGAELVEVPLPHFSYLFDITHQRSLAAFGIMRGKNATERDHARMQGFPKYEGPEFHRGHLIPHSGHGGTDINLFIQRGSINVGPFREMERRAVASPGSFYFVRLVYLRGSPAQKPVEVEQGLVLNTVPPHLECRSFPN